MVSESEGERAVDPRPEGYDELAAASAEGRAEVVRRLAAGHPEGLVNLPARGGQGAILDGIDLASSETLKGAVLGGAKLRGAKLRGGNLEEADLRGASLAGAELRGASLEKADLRDADFASADLREAAMGGADLRGALLEDVDLRGASLRFADLRGAAFENADLRRADFWGANLEGATLSGSDLRGAVFKEANLKDADLSSTRLRRASLGRADCQGARFDDSDLQGADVTGVNFRGASLRATKVQGLDLSRCEIEGIHLAGAWLERTRLGQAQFGGAIGEELSGDFDEARKGYLALERCFADLGDPDAASWAYRRKRRMQKREAGRRAQASWQARDWKSATRSGFDCASDQVVEWLCDYGESIARVLGVMGVVFLLFTLFYGATGSVVRITKTATGEVVTATRSLSDLFMFSLSAMTTSGGSVNGLEPRNDAVRVLAGVQGLIGIALTGLLGFVAGNLVRR